MNMVVCPPGEIDIAGLGSVQFRMVRKQAIADTYFLECLTQKKINFNLFGVSELLRKRKVTDSLKLFMEQAVQVFLNVLSIK